MNLKAPLFVLTGVILAMWAPAAPAQMASPFGKGTIAVEPADMDQIRAAINRALEKYTVGDVEAWKSTVTDRAGEAVLTETFERKGMKCAQVTHRFTAGVGGKTFTAPMCQIDDGSWKFAF